MKTKENSSTIRSVGMLCCCSLEWRLGELSGRFLSTLKKGRGFKRDQMAKTSQKAPVRKPNAAFMRPVTPTPALAEIVGSKPIPRTEVTKRLWAYIKKNKLQDQKNKRMIKSDATLKAVFGGKAQVNMFEMTKLVSKHLKK